MSKHKLIYQVYPTAMGTLRDITEKIPLIAKLHPDYIWLSPIFLSPWVDGGYDVADYCKIDPRFGNLNDFRRLVTTAKAYHIDILLDLVVNHTSSEHIWFKKSEHHDPWYKDYYVWRDKPLNWDSFFGGPAFDYDPIRGKYYLHLYARSQPDLNFNNPRVVNEFQKIIKFWTEEYGVAGFRVDSANILTENNLRPGFLPRIAGFFNYYQTKNTVRILEKLFGHKAIYTIAEPIGGVIFTKSRFHELTNCAFDASFNIGTLDIADTFFSTKDNLMALRYRRWFKKLAKWSVEPKFSLALESHDTPRAPSRFHASPKVLAMLQFMLPSYNPCIYQGQEIGTHNAKLSENIDDYPGVQSRMTYIKLRKEGKTKRQAMRIVRIRSRDNARQPIDWVEYLTQDQQVDSVLNFYRQLIELWRADPVIRDGKLKVKRASSTGVFEFYRIYQKQKYFIHLDFSGKTTSYLRNQNKDILIASR